MVRRDTGMKDVIVSGIESKAFYICCCERKQKHFNLVYCYSEFRISPHQANNNMVNEIKTWQCIGFPNQNENSTRTRTSFSSWQPMSAFSCTCRRRRAPSSCCCWDAARMLSKSMKLCTNCAQIIHIFCMITIS